MHGALCSSFKCAHSSQKQRQALLCKCENETHKGCLRLFLSLSLPRSHTHILRVYNFIGANCIAAVRWRATSLIILLFQESGSAGTKCLPITTKEPLHCVPTAAAVAATTQTIPARLQLFAYLLRSFAPALCNKNASAAERARERTSPIAAKRKCSLSQVRLWKT
jgi:hypothetical protein